MTKKPAMGWSRSRDATALLDRCSKAFLIDLVLDLVAQDGYESCDAPITVERLKPHLETIVHMRGDKIRGLK